MKITTVRLIPFIILTFSAFIFTQCQSEDVPVNYNFIGTWHQAARTINDNATTKDSTRILLQLNDNFICILCDSSANAKKSNTIVKRTGWSYFDNYLNLAIDLPASWKASVENTVLTMERIDFTSPGSLQKTTIQFTKSPGITF